MKNYIKLIAGICAIAIAFATPTFAADTVKAGTTVQTTAVKSTSLYNGNELAVSLGSGYVIDPAAAFEQDYNFNLTAGASYFLTKYVGVEAAVPFYLQDAVAVSEVQGGLLFRLPLETVTTLPLLKNVAPYVGASAVYNWETAQDWAYIGKAGFEARLNSKWGIFTEYQFRNEDFKRFDTGEHRLVAGLKLVF